MFCKPSPELIFEICTMYSFGNIQRSFFKRVKLSNRQLLTIVTGDILTDFGQTIFGGGMNQSETFFDASSAPDVGFENYTL